MLKDFNELENKKYQEIIFDKVYKLSNIILLKEEKEKNYIRYLFNNLMDTDTEFYKKNPDKRKKELINLNIKRYKMESVNIFAKLLDDDGIAYDDPKYFGHVVLAHMYADYKINPKIASNDLIIEIATDYAERKLGINEKPLENIS